jgi:predicted nucleic acid-binding protein
MFFADTYALLEIIAGNKKFDGYLEEKLITTRLNLMELYYALLREHKEKAGYYYDFLIPFCVVVEDDTIKKAMKLKLENKKLKMSYVDCIGYVIAIENHVKFLTGDKAFRGMYNVEFVK